MAPFKEGAFRLAIEKQVPIVPVSIPYNWIIMPDDGRLLLQRHENMVIFHDPIETTGLTTADIDTLSQQVFMVIDTELKKRNKL